MSKRKKAPTFDPEAVTPAGGTQMPEVSAGRAMTITPHEPISFEFALCPICGTIRTTDVCPVDGHRFEVAR